MHVGSPCAQSLCVPFSWLAVGRVCRLPVNPDGGSSHHTPSREHPEPAPTVRQRPACSSAQRGAGCDSAGCWRGAREVISETHHGRWNPLRGHTGRLEEQQDLAGPAAL